MIVGINNAIVPTLMASVTISPAFKSASQPNALRPASSLPTTTITAATASNAALRAKTFQLTGSECNCPKQ